MRAQVTTTLLLIAIGIHAQNWTLLNPDYRYNYTNDGSDTISNQIRVMDIDTLGADSFRYQLNPIAEACAPCNGVPPGCASNAGVFVDRPQVFGLQAIAYGPQWTLIGEDSLLVLVDAGLGANWTGPEGIQGTVSSVVEEDLFGQLDSVKRIDYSNGASMTISKVHGVTAFSADGASYALIGVQGGLDGGERFPGIIDIFDYHPGDILQYHGTNDHTDGFCVYNTIYTRKYEVLSRTDLPGYTTCSIRAVQSSYTWAYPVSGSGGCFGSSYAYESIVSLGIDHDHWTEENFLGSCWLSWFWPQAFAEPTGDAFPGDFGSQFAGSKWQAHLDEQGRYVMEPTPLDPDQPAMLWSTIIACDDDSLYWPINWDEIKGRYVEGIGRTSGRYLGFEHFQEDTLDAYRIGDLEYGEITPDDIILGVSEQTTASTPMITPVPADDLILISLAHPGSSYSILDLQGRLIGSGRLRALREQISVADLPPGAYVLRVDGMVPERFIIAR